MDYRNERLRSIAPYTAGEQPRDRRYIKLNTNENAYPPSSKVREAMLGEMDNLRLYPAPDSRVLREAAARLNGVAPEMVFAGNGSDEAIALAFQSFFDGERPIAYPAVTYSFYPVWAGFYGVDALAVPMKGELRVDVNALLDANRCIVLANPNAPTGERLGLDTVRFMCETLLKRGHLLLLDEAYAAFGDAQATALVHEFENLLIVRTLSKSHALAGLRVCYALGQRPLMDALNAAKDSFNSYPLDRLAQVGAAAALDDVDYYAQTTRRIVETRARFTEGIRALGFVVQDSQANFVFARHERVPGKDIFEGLKARGVLVRRFDAPGIEDYLRITIGTEEEMGAVVKEFEGLV